MASFKQTFILLEAVVCFLAPSIGLMLGVIFWPAVLEPNSGVSTILALMLVLVGGCFGAFALFLLIRRILDQTARLPRLWILWIFLLFGVGALVSASINFLDPDIRLFTLGLPLLATVHFVYLGRAFLCASSANKTMEPTR